MITEKRTLAFDRRIDSIQFLRFLGAMCITVYHFSGIWGACPFDFSSAVYLFYMISGFVVMLSTRKEEKKKLFLTRRLIKTLPLYWGLTVFTCCAGLVMPSFLGYTPDFIQLVKSMLFIPFARFNAKGGVAIRPIVGLGHTLQMEMLFYVMFLIAMRISHRKRGFIAAGFCLIPLLTGIFFPTDYAPVHFYTANAYVWISFLAGLGIYGIFRLIESRKIKLNTLPLNILFIALSVGMIAVALVSEMSVFYVMSAYALILICALFWAMSGFGTPKIFIKLGDISFSYYLLHYYTVSLSAKFLGINSFSIRNILLALAVSAVTWGISYISWYVIENRISGYLMKTVTEKVFCKN